MFNVLYLYDVTAAGRLVWRTISLDKSPLMFIIINVHDVTAIFCNVFNNLFGNRLTFIV